MSSGWERPGRRGASLAERAAFGGPLVALVAMVGKAARLDACWPFCNNEN